MNFIKSFWNKEDIKEYKNYSLTLKSDETDCNWEKRIVNTKLDCFGKTSYKAKEIAKQIYGGNFVCFIQNIQIENMLDSLIVAFLICKIKDFDTFKKYLKTYVLTIDNWASCDTLKFKNRNKDKLVKLSCEFLKSKKCFARRTGVNIWFEIIRDSYYLNDCFKMLNNLQNEVEYYVNMSASWLLAELFIKYRKETLEFFKNNKTNDFVINKAISKCRDSFRVSLEDKELLKTFKRKKDSVSKR